MIYAAVVVLAVVVSLDGLVAGVAYGSRSITLPTQARLIIAVASALTMGFSMVLGKVLGNLLTVTFSHRLGAALMITLGLLFIAKAKIQVASQKLPKDKVAKIAEFRLPALGVIIHILKDPEAADTDHSGNISNDEAILLGVALALDAFGAGFGAGLSHMPIVLVMVCVGILKYGFLSAGITWGARIAKHWPEVAYSYLPGVLLVALGVYNIL